LTYAYKSLIHKGVTMHIASALTVVRRATVQSDSPGSRRLRPGPALVLAPESAALSAAWRRKVLPGAILLTLLILLGGLLPILL
jgi:hypothetical protein